MKFAKFELAGLGVIGALLLAAPQIASAQEDIKIEGMITARDGERMTVTASGGHATVVTIKDTTDIKATSGALGLQRDALTPTDLIPGLPVNVEAVRHGSETDAVKVRFKSSDLKTAQQVEAGTAQAKAKVKAAQAENEKLMAQNAAKNAELQKRLSEANEYVVKGEATVLFATGSAAISAKGKADLHALAAQAVAIKGYLISIVGHTDTTGNAAANQKLSARRAAAVTNYLQQNTEVKAFRVLAADPMGQSKQIGSPDTTSGQAENRRVVVKILVNKGLEGL